jgi:hypothetical protein
MKYPYYQIKCSINGDILEDCQTLAEALITIEKWEDDDRAEGNYEQGFYEVFKVFENEDDIKIEL